jgi:cytochrome bd-type quinol oxidase subunit 1
MNYPVWDLFGLGGGLWIAVIATVHVFVSHFAVGGGLWLVLAERKALKDNDRTFLEYVKGHSKFFLLLTMVFGGLTGVGIWWTISLLNPGGTSVLIHNFVFGWAAEWVCFTGEIVALFIYYYTFGKMRDREHQIIGWFYFIFAWLSLVLISGIIGFMLTPGNWLETGNFWDGFFNPSFWPSVFFRSFLSFMIAGWFGLITAVHHKDPVFREKIVRYSAGWILVPFLLMVASAWWYLKAMPDAQESMILFKAREISPFLKSFMILTPVLVVGALAVAIRMPGAVKKPLVYLVVLTGFLHMASFEYIREAGRRPFVIHGHMYSNAILVEDTGRINEQGILKTAKWSQFSEITEDNALQAGEEIFRIECSACHSRGGILNDIMPLTRDFTVMGMEAQLAGQGRVTEYMPPFLGLPRERLALARYIVEGLHGKEETPADPFQPKDIEIEIPPFDVEADELVLLAWSNTGTHLLSFNDPWFLILPPANDIVAQLILRGETPELVTEGVTLAYKADPGLTAEEITGNLAWVEERGLYEAPMVPAVPFEKGDYNPYPLFTIEAVDDATGEVVATTRMVAPSATEMGCNKCHGGGWGVEGVVGFTTETSEAILSAHDKHSKTQLLALAKNGEPRLCASCHEDPATGTEGDPALLNLSAAVHGWHANYLTGMGAEACTTCHPGDGSGATRGLRGGHSKNLDCTHCHGTLEDHALGLLVAEKALGKPGADRLMRNLLPRAVQSMEEVVGRTPWLQEPDCLACHEDFERPDPATASAVYKWVEDESGLYRFSKDDSDLLACGGCHGPTHATYPTHSSTFGVDRENIQPLQYQGNRRPIGAGGNCVVCHGIDMEDSIHHDNMENP